MERKLNNLEIFPCMCMGSDGSFQPVRFQNEWSDKKQSGVAYSGEEV